LPTADASKTSVRSDKLLELRTTPVNGTFGPLVARQVAWRRAE
jgi:hypothetical protein